MNIKEYLENPMGKGSSAIPNRQLIISDLTTRFNNLVRDKDIKMSVYRVSNKEYLFHLIIPSETDRGNYYDVVVEFYTEDKDIAKQRSIRNYDIRLFNNAPSFVYTYANAYNDQDMLVHILKGKFQKEIFKKQPVMRNPYKVVSYEKYLFFAIRYILDDSRLMNKDIVDNITKIYNSVLFKKKIKTDSEVLLEIKKLNLKKRETIRKERKKEDRKLSDEGRVEKKETKSSVNVIKPKTNNVSKSAKTVKSIKKIKKL